MPLYEGIGLISEKYAVVFDIGSAYTKCGFAGETGPRCIVPSEIQCSKMKRKRRLCEYTSESDLYDLLVDFLHYLYFRHLLVNPKDRRVVIVESLLCPTVIRESLARVLFHHYEVSSVLFLSSSLVSLCTLGVDSALVMDVGYQEAVVVPVYEGVPVLHAWEAQPLASKAIHSNLEKLVLETCRIQGEVGEPVAVSAITSSLPESALEDIKVRTSFVTKLERGQKIQLRMKEDVLRPPFPIAYPLGGSQILHLEGTVREAAAEVLFERDNDDVSLATMLLDSVLKCPVDTRKKLCENILLIGGTSMMIGLTARLLEEMKLLQQSPKYKSRLAINTFKFHRPPAKANYVAWLGGAIFGATDAVTTRSLSREQYLQQKSVPDWASLLHNIGEQREKSL